MDFDSLLRAPALEGMRKLPQWIVWKLVPRTDGSGKNDKWPVDRTRGRPVSLHDQGNWSGPREAVDQARQLGPGHGVGFVFTEGCGYFFLDLDNCRQPDGSWSAFATAVVQHYLPGAAVEISSSGNGLHVFGRGTVPPHSSKCAKHRAEMYTVGRFAAMTGTDLTGDCDTDHTAMLSWFVPEYFPPRAAVAADTPNDGPCAGWSGPTDDAALLEIAMRSRSRASVFGDGVTFAELWTADADALARRWPADGRAYDASSADMALATRLAFFTGRDAGRIERLMRRSALVRDKWDAHATYLREFTIAKACASVTSVYTGGVRDPAMIDPTAPVGIASMPPAIADRHTLSFAAAAAGWIDAKIENVYDALLSPEGGVRVALDQFLEQVMIAGADGRWRPFNDADYGRLRVGFGKRGFKAIAPEIAKTAVLMAAEEHRFDSAIDFANGLQWDGVPRIDIALPMYFRTVDSPYTRAVGAYLFTALAGRALVPGVQADMVPVFVGLQGERKSSAVAALCPNADSFREINLKKIDDDNTARQIRGALVGEIAELRGLRGRDQESVKAWLTRRKEQWRPLFREFMTTYPRRIVFIGTANEREFLDDPSGERRWLPVVCGAVDVESIERDRDQLWAEGVARFKVSGVAWREAEHLARAEHAKFKVTHPWQEPIEQWLLSASAATGKPPNGALPFKMADVCLGALHRPITTIGKAEEMLVGKILGSLGYASGTARGDGQVGRVWKRIAPAGQRP